MVEYTLSIFRYPFVLFYITRDIKENHMDKSEVIRKIAREDLQRITLSCPRKDPSKTEEEQIRKTVIRPVLIRDTKLFQAESWTAKQAFHRNMSLEELAVYLEEQMENHFAEANITLPGEQVLVKFSKKGKILYKTVKSGPAPEKTAAAPATQNREKHYLIREGAVMQPLVDLGVMTPQGKIIASRYDKFKQINRFVELVSEGIEPEVEAMNIIDFGCGKSYLTFVLYDFLTRVRNIRVQMVGLDLKADVIKKCNQTAQKYGYDNLTFQVGDIASYQPEFDVDMVITLHACDTATDLALFHAIRWDTDRIYSVPCCQHELNLQMNRQSAGTISEHGLLRERFAAILTDAIRADLLRASGYSVDVMEFVDMEHSPKNIMLRCRKIRSRNTGRQAALKARQRVEEAMNEYQVSPMLYRLLYGQETILKEEQSHE